MSLLGKEKKITKLRFFTKRKKKLFHKNKIIFRKNIFPHKNISKIHKNWTLKKILGWILGNVSFYFEKHVHE